MAKPKPVILLESTGNDLECLQVLLADCMYGVCWNNTPINIRIFDRIANLPSKYRRTSFANPGHAQTLADMLNRVFSTKDFKVYELSIGREYKK